MELVINERKHPLECLVVAVVPEAEQRRDLAAGGLLVRLHPVGIVTSLSLPERPTMASPSAATPRFLK